MTVEMIMAIVVTILWSGIKSLSKVVGLGVGMSGDVNQLQSYPMNV
jgi:hypothetical protein